MRTSLFAYHLPKNLIANSPAIPRDHSRLMIIDRKTGKISHEHFYDLVDHLTANDVLVLNKTKVFPARIFVKKVTGGSVELLFLEEVKPKIWAVLTHPGLKPGANVAIGKHLFTAVGQHGISALIDTRLSRKNIMQLLLKYGHTPLPPYIKSEEKESDLRKEYQTVYAAKTGSVAAPTAGFHFTDRLLNKIKAKGVQVEHVTLHVGLGTFVPVKTEEIEKHIMHSEEYFVDKGTLRRLNEAKNAGKRIITVGTTSTRTLESVVNNGGLLDPNKAQGSTNIFIYPPFKFKFVDAIITNFHLPKSTLLALVSAFVTYPNTKSVFKDFETSILGKAYKIAIKEKYRFYSFGDSSLII